jgi:hypothetical protein
MTAVHPAHHNCAEATPASTYIMIGICRSRPGERFLIPVFSGPCGEPCAQLFDKTDEPRITGFVHMNLGEEYRDVVDRYSAALGDEVIYGFETAVGDFVFAPARHLAERLVEEPHLVGDCPSTAKAVRSFVLQMGVRAPTPLGRLARNWLVRVIFSLVVVFGTYGYSHMVRSGSFTPVDAVTGVILLACWLRLLGGCVRIFRRFVPTRSE